MRILIADDHAVLRQGLKQILADEFPEAEFGESGTVQETLALIDQRTWNVLLLDIFMPEGSGLEVLQKVSLRRPPLPVLVLSSAPEEQMALRVLQAGAAGYLNKQTAPENLIVAIRKILSGEYYVSPRMAEKMVRQVAIPARSQARHEQLSTREYQVLQMLIHGKSLKEIAAALSISPKTASTFHTRILKKLGAQNDVQLVHYALDHGLLDRTGKPQVGGGKPS